MEKRVVIAGCRNYTDYEHVKQCIDQTIANFKEEITWILVTGTCRGVDQLGERYADEKGWRIERFPAEWKQYGRAAGPIRNKKMIEACDCVICFWDGESKGAQSLIQYAKEAHKPLTIFIIPPSTQESN